MDTELSRKTDGEMYAELSRLTDPKGHQKRIEQLQARLDALPRTHLLTMEEQQLFQELVDLKRQAPDSGVSGVSAT